MRKKLLLALALVLAIAGVASAGPPTSPVNDDGRDVLDLFVYNGAFHCHPPNTVTIWSETYGFGFLDSTGYKEIRIENSGGNTGSVRWNNTEMDQRYHYWSTNQHNLVKVEVEHGNVNSAGNADITIICLDVTEGETFQGPVG